MGTATTRDVHVPYVVEQDEDGMWTAYAQLEKAGFKVARTPAATATFALLAEQGVHVRTIQQILGHVDVRTTQGYVNPWELHQTGEKSQVAC